MSDHSAPMVLPRTPGSVVEATHRDQRGLWMLTPLRDWVMSDINNTAVLAATEGLTVHRVLFDAATPAASVPAADILALADKWAREPYPTDDTEQPDLIQRTRAATCGNHAAVLRALVAAAEQADKGEAADTPRVSHTNANVEGCVTCRNIQELGCMCGPNGCECPAPAAPVGEPQHRDWCKKPWKGYCTCYDGTACTICHEAPGDCEHQPTPARVPANGEAEAEPPAMVFLTDEERDYLAFHGVNLHTPPCEQCPEAQAAIESVLAARLAGFRAARGEDA